MDSEKILKILEQMNLKEDYTKIFINGTWGIGKSYYAQEYIKNNSQNFAYVTLFGKTNFDSIENEIANQLVKKLDFVGKSKKKIKNFMKKLNGSFSYKGFSIGTPDLKRKSMIAEYSSLLNSKSLIIVIDDLERKSGNVLIEDIMGMIEEFSQYNKVKIIIIGDECNMDENDRKKWKKFKEKIIEKEYRIMKFSENSIDNLVVNEIKNYIDESEIENFIEKFIKKHKVKNLRTIKKGINLFKEIINNHIQIKDNKKVNLMLLENCMSVAIECTEQIYKPDEKNKEKNPFQYSIDNDIETRIIDHYFKSLYVNSKDTCTLYYVLKIFNSEYNFDVIDKLNNVIEGYINVKPDEKNIFYLSEKEIKEKVNNIYNDMKSGKYKFDSLDNFINDFYEITTWNDVLDLKYSLDELSIIFNNILLKNYYNLKNEIYQNKIDRFNIKRSESPDLDYLINNYNKEVDIKYIDEKLDKILKSYNNGEYDVKLLEWVDVRLMQEGNTYIINKFMNLCEENKFFMPDISIEIDDNIWHWTHQIWKIFYQRMNEKNKIKFNKYAESLKNNKLSTYRINALQEYRPLVST